MAKILITFGVPAEGFFDALSNHTIIIPPAGERFPHETLMALLPTAEIVVACTAVTREMIDAAKSLKLIVCYGAGYDAINVAAATEKGIPVCNIPQPVASPTAELAIAHILCLARRMIFLDQAVRQQPLDTLFVMGRNMGVSLEGSALGLVGMGHIGGRVAAFGHAMGMTVFYTAPTPKPDIPYAVGLPLKELMTRSDFISIHCPQTADTVGLIDAAMLALMKPTAYLINTARGSVVDEQALLDALRRKAIAGAGLDVYPQEPQINPGFLALDNVVLTPHMGANTAQARRHMADAVSASILAFLRGEAPPNLLNVTV